MLEVDDGLSAGKRADEAGVTAPRTEVFDKPLKQWPGCDPTAAPSLQF